MNVSAKSKSSAFRYWPSPQDYNEAVQNPASSFADRTLALSEAETDLLGLPRPSTGMFASVYRMRSDDADWALRCFLRFAPDQAERYAAISEALQNCNLESTLPFEFQQRGVLVKGEWFPVVKMRWCEGQTLDRWLYSRLYDRNSLQNFLSLWRDFSKSFHHAGIAHGDLQSGNILLEGDRIKLVDYDGMYVPSLRGNLSNELGHRDFQHPGRSKEHFADSLDNFSEWLIYLTVEILSIDPQLWFRLRAGEENLLFRRSDFDDPSHSEAFSLLANHENAMVREATRTLRSLLDSPFDEIPPLTDLAAVVRGVSPEDYERVAGQNSVSCDSYSSLEGASVFSYQGKKRRRSRIKGGYSGWRPRRVGTSPEQKPPQLSGLAELVRAMQSGKTAPVEIELPLPDPDLESRSTESRQLMFEIEREDLKSTQKGSGFLRRFSEFIKRICLSIAVDRQP